MHSPRLWESHNGKAMLFDDRLGTVLRLNASGPAVLRIQFRQLLDLLGTCPADARGEQLDAAYLRLGELAQEIPVNERAQAISDAGLRLRSPRLVAALAAGEPMVAAAVLVHARLTTDQWLDLIPAIPPAARNHLHQRRDLSGEVAALLSRLGVTRQGLPAAQSSAIASESTSQTEALPPQPHAPEPLNPQSGISAIVKRIEAYRRARQGGEPGSVSSPRLPLGEDLLQGANQVRAFDFSTDPECRINWSDPGVVAMVSGIGLTDVVDDHASVTLLRRRQPLQTAAAQLQGGSAITGEWLLDAAPWFDPISGRFLGYRGRMRRPSAQVDLALPVRERQGDRMREMLHELRTPVNAIQGFAEVIQQQLFGPTPHEYRALAASIAGDAARILSAFEELDRLAKLHSGAMDLEIGETDLAAVVEATVSQLSSHLAPRGSGFSLRIRGEQHRVGIGRAEAERIVWRLLATIAGVSGMGEILKAGLEPVSGGLNLNLTLPANLAATRGEDLFDAAADAIPQSLSAGAFGVGFSLRLARAEAQAAGGKLTREGDLLRLTLPVIASNDAFRPDWAKDHLN